MQLKDWKYREDKANGSLHFELKESVTASYVKINTLWNDRDFDWNVVDRGEFRNKPLNMLRVTVLESSNSEKYEYDLSGNRVNGITYYKNISGGNTALRKSDGVWTYEYDANGNRTSKKSVSGKESWTYTWDLHNRLIKVEQKNPDDNGTPVKVSYEYDGLNYRISRTGTDGKKTEYAYGRNGAVIVEKRGSETRSYVYANGVIAGFVDSDGKTSEIRYCITDHQGSVTEIIDEKGSVLWESCYTAFGVKGGESVNRIEFTGMFTGKDIDPETGLTYHWNRWRSEDGSVWLSEDPARDGTNWYGYCGNNPVMFVDPNGLIAETAWDIASLSLGIVSLGYNIYHGNTKEAIFDGIGILADAAAVALPFIPGGVGAARKAVKATKIAAEAVGGTEAVISGGKSIAEGIQNGDYLEASLGALQAVAGAGQLGNAANQASSLIEKVETPYGLAKQSLSKAALQARESIENNGAIIYRGGTIGISETAGGQFWSLENPLTTPNYASNYGIPVENFKNMNFVETSTIKQGDLFITRPAPGIGTNIGGGIEVVIPSGSITIDSFSVVK